MSLNTSINPIDASSGSVAGPGSFIRSPRISTWAVMRTLLVKDVRAAALPLAIVVIFAVITAVHALVFASNSVRPAWVDLFVSALQAIQTASVVGSAVLPAWVAVELAFLEASPGRRSVLPALPPSLAHVVASKALVLLACVVLLAASAWYAQWAGHWISAARAGMTTPTPFVAPVALWCWTVCSAVALAGLGAPALARDRAVGFVVAIGVPGVVVFACWGFGFGLEGSAAIAVMACAWLAWIARRAVSGAEVGNIGRILRRRHVGNVSTHRSGNAAGAGHVMITLLRKDARAVAPVVAAALVFVLGFAAFALALPAFGERVMQQFGIGISDPILRRLQVAVPVSILAQLVMPGIAALVLAYCDGRAAGRPMAALPVGRGALAASKVLVCLAVLALFFGISLALDGASTRGVGTGGGWFSTQQQFQLWEFMLLCASGIAWCLALPAFFGDRRAGALAAVIGVPALFMAFGFAMQWISEGWYDLITVRLLGVHQWRMSIVAHRGSLAPMLPLVLAWFAAGAVAAIVAVPVFTASASVARVRRRAVVDVAIAAAITTVGGALAFVLPQVPFDEYQRNLRWEQDVEKAAREEKLEILLQDVVVRAGSVPRDPPRLSEPGARYEETDAPFVLEAILQKAPRVTGLFRVIEPSRPGGPARLSEHGGIGALDGPRDFALAIRAAKEPAEAAREFRRVADDVRIDAGIRIAAASWLGAVPAAMTAARVLVASDTRTTERAFAIAVLAGLRHSLKPQDSTGEPAPDPMMGLQPFDAGYKWCRLRYAAINALTNLERLAGHGADPGRRFPAAGLGLAPDCAVDESVVRRARERLVQGTSDLCIVLRALGNSSDVVWPRHNDMRPEQSEVESACECLLRVIP